MLHLAGRSKRRFIAVGHIKKQRFLSQHLPDFFQVAMRSLDKFFHIGFRNFYIAHCFIRHYLCLCHDLQSLAIQPS